MALFLRKFICRVGALAGIPQGPILAGPLFTLRSWYYEVTSYLYSTSSDLSCY